MIQTLIRSKAPTRAALALLGLALASPSLTTAAASPPTDTAMEDTVGPIQLRDVSLDQVLEMIERMSGRTLLRPQNLPGATISLSLEKPVPKAEALRALETVLQLNGIVHTLPWQCEVQKALGYLH